jgi:hypothetical protein
MIEPRQSRSGTTLTRAALLASLFLAARTAAPARAEYAAYTNVQVNTLPNNPEETAIAINPTDPANVLGVAQTPCRFYPSFDGGATWAEGTLSDPYQLGDPSVIFDIFGHAYYCYIGTWTHSGIFINKSTDGGRTWRANGTPVIQHVGDVPFEDKSYPVSDWTNGPGRGNIYVSWTQFDHYGSTSPGDSSRILFSRSIDRGDTYSTPIRLSDHGGDAVDSDLTVEGAMPAVGPDGTVYVAWSGPRGIEFDRSTDGGITFGRDRIISDQPGGWDFNVTGIYRCNGLPVTKVDISGAAYRGRVYVLWGDQRFGDADVFLLASDDGGASWGNRVRVNNDPQGNGRDQFFPWMDVDPVTGKIAAVFYDRREHADNLTTDVYLALSTDGGETFSNERISTTPFIPSSGMFFGDYTGVAIYDGMIRPLWMRMDGFTLSAWTALINPPPADTSDLAIGPPRLVVLPNPARDEVRLLSRGTGPQPRRLVIFDVRGRVVRSLEGQLPEFSTRGGIWDARDAAGEPVSGGVYYLLAEPRPSARIVIIR